MNAPVKANTPAATTTTSAAISSQEEDDEIQLAMEMALAAAQNPHLSPAEIRKLVGQKNEQAVIVAQHQQQKEEKKQKEKEEAARKWVEQKEKAFTWWSGKAAAVKNKAADLREAAAQRAEELKYRAECQLYAEEIRQDREIIETRKKMKFLRKTIKAHRLHGNRAETRHMFKRQRMEKQLIQLNDRVKKTQLVMTNSSYNVHEYAKAMLRASRKWKKRCTDEELTLEAQLCRNMHQMLALEKQKTILKKSTREIKKYMQRCKGWLSDKQAFYEMNMITLDATASSMKLIYEDMVMKQDNLVKKLIESGEFEGIDVKKLEVPQLNFSDAPLSPGATLCALRGLPISDSIRLKKEELAQIEADLKAEHKKDEKPHVVFQNGRPELLIETKDDVSVSSHMTDPEEFAIMKKNQDSDSDFDFGNDAPWMASESDLGVVHEIQEKGAADYDPTESTDTSNNLFPTPLGLAGGRGEDSVEQSSSPSSRSSNSRAANKNTIQGKDMSKVTVNKAQGVSETIFEKPNKGALQAQKAEEDPSRRRFTEDVHDAVNSDNHITPEQQYGNAMETPLELNVTITPIGSPIDEQPESETLNDESNRMVADGFAVQNQGENEVDNENLSREDEDEHLDDDDEDAEEHDEQALPMQEPVDNFIEATKDGSDHVIEHEEQETGSAPIQSEHITAEDDGFFSPSSAPFSSHDVTVEHVMAQTTFVIDSVPVSEMMANRPPSPSAKQNVNSDGLSESNNSALVGAFIDSPADHMHKGKVVMPAFEEPIPFTVDEINNNHFDDAVPETPAEKIEAMNYSWNSGAFSSSDEDVDDNEEEED